MPLTGSLLVLVVAVDFYKRVEYGDVGRVCNVCRRFEVPVNSADDPDTVVIPVYMREVMYVASACYCCL